MQFSGIWECTCEIWRRCIWYLLKDLKTVWIHKKGLFNESFYFQKILHWRIVLNLSIYVVYQKSYEKNRTNNIGSFHKCIGKPNENCLWNEFFNFIMIVKLQWIFWHIFSNAIIKMGYPLFVRLSCWRCFSGQSFVIKGENPSNNKHQRQRGVKWNTE